MLETRESRKTAMKKLDSTVYDDVSNNNRISELVAMKEYDDHVSNNCRGAVYEGSLMEKLLMIMRK